MSGFPKLSNHAQAALEVLKEGGWFKYSLVRNSFTGREQFQWRLHRVGGFTVKGYGHHTFHELNNAGFMGYGEPSGFIGTNAIYRLNLPKIPS